MKETRFKETEIGRIPEDWEVVKLEDKGALLRGSINPQMFPQKQFVEYSMPSFDNGCIPEVKNGFSMQSGRTCIKSPVLLYNKLNVRQRRIWYIETCPDDSICSMEFLPYVSDKIDLCCLKYFVNTDKVTADFVGMSKGTSNSQKRIAPSDFLEYKIGLPKEKEEQTRIASALTSIDSLISSLDKLIEKKKNIKQGTMQQLLTGKKRLNGFNEPWVEITLGEIALDIRTGKRNGNENQVNGKYPFFVRSEKVYKIDAYSFDGEAILIPGEGGIGKIYHYINGKFDFHQRVYKISNFDNADGKFVYYYLSKFFGIHALENTAKATVDSLRVDTFLNFNMITPKDMVEQSAIASVLTSMDNAIAALEAKKAKYEQIKQGMMQQLLTGKIRLVESASESKVRKANIHFKRSVVAAEIADRLCEEPTFGHVKMMKMLFLAERLCHIELDSHYHRDAAGPYDNRALRSIDGQLKRQGWFEAKNVGGRIVYIPLQRRGNHKKYFNKYYAGCASVLDKITETFRTMTTEQCEIVATLFSAWEDLLHAGKSCTENDIVNEVLNNWHESKQRISREHWLNAIVWMRREGFVPQVETL